MQIHFKSWLVKCHNIMQIYFYKDLLVKCHNYYYDADILKVLFVSDIHDAEKLLLVK